MAKLLKLRRGTTTQHGSFTGAEGEVTVDTDKETLVVHDGSTAGGHPVAAEDLANVSSSTIAGRLANDSLAVGKLAAGALPTDVTVQSANIVDGTIVNADVNASAAIAGTKIAPDFGSQNVATTGTLGCGEITTTGHINLEDNKNIKLGNSQDFLIYHNGSNSIINDNGTGDLQLTSNGTKITLQGGSDTMANFIKDAAVQLYYDNTMVFETVGGGVYIRGNLNFGVGVTGNLVGGDNDKIILGTGGELEIYHDGSHSNIVDTGTGNLRIFGDSQIFFGRSIGGEAYATFNSDGAVNLYYDNSI